MEPLDILTFNIRGEDVSHWAQDGFKREHKYERIAALVRSHSPHAVTLQEVCDDMAGLMQDEMEEWGFTQLCSAPSPHLVSSTSGTSSGGTFIYVESNLVDAVELPAVGPVALARICQPRLIDNSDVDVFLAACHLNHGGKEGAARRDQLAAALAALPEGCLVVVAGDTNLRGQYEDNLVKGLGLEDAFEQVGCPVEERHTWDSFNNLYHGPNQGLYQRERYDRVLLRGGLRASRLQLIGTEPVTPGQPDGQGKVDCLSDHFGLLCTIEL